MVHQEPGQPAILYIDCHLVHEVTSAQAFEGLRLAGRKVRRPNLTYATADHNVPTWDRSLPITDALAKLQIDTLGKNCEEFEIPLFGLDSPDQGIVHVIGPELGITNPGRPWLPSFRSIPWEKTVKSSKFRCSAWTVLIRGLFM